MRASARAHAVIALCLVAALACGTETTDRALPPDPGSEVPGDTNRPPPDEEAPDDKDPADGSNSCAAESGPLSFVEVAASDSESGNPAANATDGDLQSRWSCNGAGCTLTADFGQVRTVEELQVAWYRGDERRSSFVISLSTDGDEFVELLSSQSTGESLELESYPITPTEARFVRLTVNGNDQNQWASVTELQAVGFEPCDGQEEPPPAEADTEAPSIEAPADRTVQATGTLTQVSLGTPVVSDDRDPNPSVTNDAPAAGFPVGTTVVTWRATDSAGNSATDTQRVTVTEVPLPPDTQPPSITAPADRTVQATGTLTQVSLGTPVVSDDRDPNPSVTNDAPAAGFPVGV
ncbi:MAG: discoidin domain-containing protein, partial [Myxococcales bacterium]